ncbi:MAG: flippase-like domain-containing protein [Bdellovibrionales bacterium]|nr:flippase-like domain-containing protein [Bdellovibrionales bacterium]
MSKPRRSWVEFFKWAFSLTVLVLLIRSGKLSLSDVRTFLEQPWAGVACLGIMACVLSLAFFRWRLLLLSQGIPLPYRQAVHLGMLGQFFSTFIPGTVGGDLVKAVYVAKKFPGSKLKSVSTILVDRIMGLSSMFFLGGIAFLVGRGHLAMLTDPKARLIELLGWTLLAAASVMVLGLLLLPTLGNKLPAKFFPGRNFPLKKHIEPLYEAAISYRHCTSALWKVLAVSCCIHLLNIAMLFTISRVMFGPYPWGEIDVATFILGGILGLAAQGIPVAPMGLGVGQFAFAAIFQTLGAPSDRFGAAIITGMQLVTLVGSLSGAFFFATYRHEVHASELA